MFGVAYLNYFFDTNNYDNPLQFQISNDHEYTPISSMKKKVSTKIKRNHVVDNYSNS